jgi:hypothetical protein
MPQKETGCGEAAIDARWLNRMSVWSAALTALLAAVSFAFAITTLPKAGPLAKPEHVIPYPYVDASAFVPADFIWMYPALLWLAAFLVLSVSLRERAAPGRGIFGTIGLCLATLSVTVIAVNYFIQLQTVQPALVKGEGADIVAWSQYNPHGMYIALENLGFLVMALSLGCFAFCLGSSRNERIVRWLFLAAAMSGIVSFIGMWLYFGVNLEYLFEVTIIAIDWFTLIVSGTLLAFAFARSPVVFDKS